ncbi:MAG: S8 family serine peptidase [Bacteroidota bacterium]
MRKFVFVLGGVLVLASHALLGQQRILRKAAFEETELNQKWIIVKYKRTANIASQAVPIHPRIQKNNIDQTSNGARKTPNSDRKRSVLDGMVRVPVPQGQDPIDFCNKYLKNNDVLYAEPIVENHLLEVVSEPSDPLVSDQYYLNNINAFAAWEITKGDDDIVVGVIDTGADLDHEDLQSNLWVNTADTIDGIDNDENGFVDDYYGFDFSDNDADPDADQSDHGMIVAGIVGATPNNDLGLAGVGYNTKVAVLKGFSSFTGFGIGLFDAIIYGADNGIDVLNLSWGSIRKPLQSEQDIIDYAVLERDVVVVAAAGNDGAKPTAQEKFYPASYNHILAVAGTTNDDSKWAGSSYNHAVDLVAPSAAILSTTTGNRYKGTASGTSFAAPQVAAVAALVKHQHPALNAVQIMERIRVSTDFIDDLPGNQQFAGKLGSGRLNAQKALSDQDLKSVRAAYQIKNKSEGEPIFFGDTLKLSIGLSNFLSPVNDPFVFVSSENDSFTASENALSPGPIGTLHTAFIEAEIFLSESLVPESPLEIRLDFQDGLYTDFQFFDLKTAPDHAVFGNSKINMPIAGDGRINVIDYNRTPDETLSIDGESILAHAGIIIATDSLSISNNIVSDFTTLERDNDFITSQYFKIAHHPFADRYASSAFEDEKHHLLIEQSSFTSDSGNFIINRYRVVNTGTDTLKSLSVGIFTDWDLGTATTNHAAFDSKNSILWTGAQDSTRFAGTQILGVGAKSYNTLNLKAQGGNSADLGNSFDKMEKYGHLISSSLDSAGFAGEGTNVAGIQGTTISQLAPAGYEYLDLIFATGESRVDLIQAFQEARGYLQELKRSPTVLETLYSCDGGNTIIDPEGEMFIFYQDPLGTQVLDTAEFYRPGNISTDTVFYVQNLDLGYPSAIQAVRVRLFEEVAAFEIDNDTLYLDHPTINTVQFLDQSIGAVSWAWDFGQGTRSSLQNPAITFQDEGVYQIQLSVETKFGCAGTIEKKLVVARRPAPLEFEQMSLCPGESGTIQHPEATHLYLYTTESQSNPISSGQQLKIGPFETDTSLYVSGRINGFTTLRSPVEIEVKTVLADLKVAADTTSTDFRIYATVDVEADSEISWIVDGVEMGSSAEISIPATEGIHTFTVHVLGANGCSVSKTHLFEVSSSPTAIVSDLTGCAGERVVLQPKNGHLFGFYQDAEISKLIHKGSEIAFNESSKVFVVSLDDGLPGKVVESVISFSDFNPEIQFTSTLVGERNKISLSASSTQEIKNFEWFIDDDGSKETTSSPVLFFENRLVTITLKAESMDGCIGEDTLVLDFTSSDLILGNVEENALSVFPNPSPDGKFKLSDASKVDKIRLKDLSGKVLYQAQEIESNLDFSKISKGIYILELAAGNEKQQIKLVLE